MSASSPQPAALQAALRQAGDLGRRHGRAAVNWQIGDSDSGREFYRELLRGIASADPAITGLYAVPDLTARWDYERENLAADLGLPDGGSGWSARLPLSACRSESSTESWHASDTSGWSRRDGHGHPAVPIDGTRPSR